MHVKYIHILWFDESRFSGMLIDLLNNTPALFHKEEHLFVTPYERTFQSFPGVDNIELYHTSKPQSADIINAVAPRCDWIIMHGICSWREVLRIKPRYLGKIVWRTWGGNKLATSFHNKGMIRMLVKKALHSIAVRRVNQFAAVGIHNIVDQFELEKIISKPPMYILPYWQKGRHDTLSKMVLKKPVQNKKAVNVMIGHSGYYEDHHISIMKDLEKFKNEAIHIYLVLAYGDRNYVNEIKEYALSTWKDKVTVIEDYKRYNEYVSFLDAIDIAILDSPVQNALGTIALLLFLQKKIYLNPDGVMYRAFQHYNIPCGTVDSIGGSLFSDFSAPVEYPNDSWKMLSVETDDYCYGCWTQLLHDLDGRR